MKYVDLSFIGYDNYEIGEDGVVYVKGTKEVIKVEISDKENFEKDDLDMLEDMILVALNDAFEKVDAETEKKMGKYSNIPGLF